MLDVKCWMLSVECDHAAREYFSHGCHRSTQKPCRVLLSKNTDCTDAHGWVFSRILCSCSAAYRLVLMRRRRNGLPRIFSHAEGALRSEKSVEIREICGRQLSAQCAKEQAGCIYSPTDLSDKHRCHADYLSITQIALSARQIDTDFSHAESNMYGSMPHDGACLIRGKSV